MLARHGLQRLRPAGLCTVTAVAADAAAVAAAAAAAAVAAAAAAAAAVAATRLLVRGYVRSQRRMGG